MQGVCCDAGIWTGMVNLSPSAATGLMRWTLTSTAANAPLGPANVPPPLPSGTYTLQNIARVAGGAACRSYASVGQACGAVLIDGW